MSMGKPVAWIKERELTYMRAVAEHGATEWRTNLGLTPEEGDVPLYLAREWVGLTPEEAKEISLANRPYVIDMIAALEARLKEKNT